MNDVIFTILCGFGFVFLFIADLMFFILIGETKRIANMANDSLELKIVHNKMLELHLTEINIRLKKIDSCVTFANGTISLKVTNTNPSPNP